MRKLLLISLGAIAMEVLAMEVKVMHLPSVWSVIFGILAVVCVVVVLFEKSNPDEREQAIAYRSSHIAFLSVATVLTGILLYQTLSRVVEPWTLAAIAALVFGKIIGNYLAQRHH